MIARRLGYEAFTMRRFLVALVIGLAVTALPLTTSAATVASAITVKFPGAVGAARMTRYVGGTGQVYVNLKGLASGRWAEYLYAGSCISLGTRLAILPALIVPATGQIARANVLTSAQARAKSVRIVRTGHPVACASFVAAPTPIPTPTPTPTPSPIAGSSRENPIRSAHVPGRVGDWEITLNGALPNATGAVLAANQFNDPPAAGNQFYMVIGSARYLGAGSEHFGSALRFKAVGAANVGYVDYADSCGVLPKPDLYLDNPEVFTGGMVGGNLTCWEVRSSDVGSLVMYVEDDDGHTVWFALP